VTSALRPRRATPPTRVSSQARRLSVSSSLHSLAMRAPYGTWKSPLTSEAVTAKVSALCCVLSACASAEHAGVSQSTSVDDVIVDRVKGTVYHLERRPKEGGRSVLVDTRTNKDLVPAGFNVRTRGTWSGC
jgi:hypothetical protein